jgi:hypothetical protein
MNFWLRNIILGTILSALAYAFIANQDLLLSIDGPISKVNAKEQLPPPAPDPNADKSDEKKEKPKVASPTSGNSAADGLSRMYANLHGDMGKNGPQIRNNIVYLPPIQGDLTKILKAREMMVRPFNNNWKGNNELRRFTKGDTLIQKLVEYTKKEDVELLWWLERDFVVKNPFRVDKNLLVTVYQTAKSVEGHFPSGLSIFFCPKQRSVAVIESGPHEFLDKECMLLKSEKPY